MWRFARNGEYITAYGFLQYPVPSFKSISLITRDLPLFPKRVTSLIQTQLT